jgi:hypothetical protein
MSDGKAVLFILLPNGKTTTDVFLESESDDDPHYRAEQTLAAVGDDFPGMMHAIAINERARDLMTNRRMAAMGFTDYDHASERPTGASDD